MGNPHIIVIPYPAQSHVISMLELSQQLTNHHFKVTFVNTDFDHRRIIKSLSDSDNILEQVTMVSIPDGLEPWEDRSDLGKLTESVWMVMPAELEALIERINGGEEEEKIVGVIADWNMGWALEVAERKGLKRAAFCPAAAGVLALVFNIPRMVSDGIVDDNGKPLKNQTIHLSPAMPPINSNNFIWTHIGDLSAQRRIFHILVRNNNFSSKFTNWLICNSSYDLEPGVFSLYQNIIPIGPLLAKNRLGKSVGHFWPGDSSCLEWLNQQPPNSVVYIAFGSFTIFDQEQFEELALGLELTNRPFLWVVRQDITSGTGMKAYHQTVHLSHSDTDIIYPKGFKERVEKRGQRVRWAPQQEVLSHPSIALFISHCGWNSTIEGISNGVPFLCWPYFLDQFINRSYIVDCWEVGLELEKDESGIVRKEEIRNKVELVMSDKRYKTRALNLQSKVVSSAAEGGSSQKNFSNFADWIKENKVIY